MPNPDQVSTVTRPSGRLPVVTVLALLYFFPASLPYLFGASSFAVGVVLVLAVGWVIYGMGWSAPLPPGTLPMALGLAFATAFFIVLHLVVASQIGDVDFSRGISSLAILLFIIISAFVLSTMIFSVEDSTIVYVISVVAVIFIVIAALSIAGIQPPTESVGEKPIFPYTEPSFFAFTFAPVLIYLTVSSPLWLRAIWLLISLGLALVLANLTLMVVVLLAAVIALPVSVLAASIFAGVSLAGLVDLKYFTDRIDFTLNTTNLSTLVYIQGWQLLDESLRNTWGWGLGFQQLGFGYTNVSASIRLNQLLGFDLNLADGGFILAKIGSELGIFGLILAGTLLVLSFRSIIFLRLMTHKKHNIPARLVFAHATAAAAVIELLVRGANYFTGSLVMVLAACIFLLRSGRRTEVPAA